MLTRTFDLAVIKRKLKMNKGATMEVTADDGTVSTVNIAELAALDGIAASDLAKIDGITNGTAAAGKALVLGASKEIATITSATITTLTNTTVNTTNVDAGASGTAGTVDIFPTTASKGKLILSCTDQDADTTVTLKPAAMAQASVISIPDPGAATANVLLTSAANDQAVVTATSVELNYNDITTLGTLEASKTWTSDASLDTVMPTGGLLTVQSGGQITLNSGSTLAVAGTANIDGATTTTVAAAEHGAGAIGTAVAPRTYRWTDRGVIITQTKVDLTGLASVATANDVIGLSAGGVAYIGRNVEATNGIIYKVEFACIETPTGGDNDVNVVANSSAALAYDGAGGTAYLSNSGDLLKGQTIENLVPALTEGDYFYLTAGTGDTAAAYTAGMYILTTYGHAALS